MAFLARTLPPLGDDAFAGADDGDDGLGGEARGAGWRRRVHVARAARVDASTCVLSEVACLR